MIYQSTLNVEHNVEYRSVFSGDELRYDYGVKSNEWRRKCNWKLVDGKWIFEEQILEVTEIDYYDSIWCCADEGDVDSAILPTIRLSCRSQVDLVSIGKFCSLANLDRNNLPNFTVKNEKLKFTMFDDTPLGIPDEYLQTRKTGACFYNCLSWALTCSNFASQELRVCIGTYLEENYVLYEEMYGGSKEDHKAYIEKQRKPGEYADHIELMVACRVFDVNIFVYQEAPEPVWSLFTLPDRRPGRRGSIYLKFIQEHYMLVTSVALGGISPRKIRAASILSQTKALHQDDAFLKTVATTSEKLFALTQSECPKPVYNTASSPKEIEGKTYSKLEI